jgi:hypothetical protein
MRIVIVVILFYPFFILSQDLNNLAVYLNDSCYGRRAGTPGGERALKKLSLFCENKGWLVNKHGYNDFAFVEEKELIINNLKVRNEDFVVVSKLKTTLSWNKEKEIIKFDTSIIKKKGSPFFLCYSNNESLFYFKNQGVLYDVNDLLDSETPVIILTENYKDSSINNVYLKRDYFYKKITLNNIEVSSYNSKNTKTLICAHFDHLGVSNNGVFYGGNDNISGVIAAIMMADKFEKNKKDFSLVFFNSEEQGLTGSKKYAETHCFDTVINFDMLGGKSIIYEGKQSELKSSDHKPFIGSANFVFFVTSEENYYYHTTLDVWKETYLLKAEEQIKAVFKKLLKNNCEEPR